MAKTVNDAGDAGKRERLLTVARLRGHPKHSDVMFFETPRIYRLLGSSPDYENTLRLLREAAATGTPVHVRFIDEHGDVIEAVSADK